MEYPQFDAPEWGKKIRTVMGDIIRNKRRHMFREARKENPQAPIGKRGRSAKENALNKRQRMSIPLRNGVGVGFGVNVVVKTGE